MVFKKIKLYFEVHKKTNNSLAHTHARACARRKTRRRQRRRCAIRVLRVVCTRASRFRGASLRGPSTDLFLYVEATAVSRCHCHGGTGAEASVLASGPARRTRGSSSSYRT